MLEKILEEIENEICTKKLVWESLEKPPYNDFEQSLWIAGMRNAKEIIRKHMENDGWIPVEERLPEERKEVLAQFEVRVRNVKNEVIKTTYMHVMYLEGGIWKSDMGISNGKVIAWQPLPEPYRTEN